MTGPVSVIEAYWPIVATGMFVGGWCAAMMTGMFFKSAS